MECKIKYIQYGAIIYTIKAIQFLSRHSKMYIDGSFHKKISALRLIPYVCQGYNIIGMLVREQTKEIEISMDNKIVSIKRDTKEYTYKRKIYNFNEIEDDDSQQHKTEKPNVQNNQLYALENHQTQPDMPPERNRQIIKDNKSRFNTEKDAYRQKLSQRGQPIMQKDESYVLLKLLGGLLIILLIMTIFQTYYPQSQFNLLRIFNSPIKTSFSTPTNSTMSDL